MSCWDLQNVGNCVISGFCCGINEIFTPLGFLGSVDWYLIPVFQDKLSVPSVLGLHDL